MGDMVSLFFLTFMAPCIVKIF